MSRKIALADYRKATGIKVFRTEIGKFRPDSYYIKKSQIKQVWLSLYPDLLYLFYSVYVYCKACFNSGKKNRLQ